MSEKTTIGKMVASPVFFGDNQVDFEDIKGSRLDGLVIPEVTEKNLPQFVASQENSKTVEDRNEAVPEVINGNDTYKIPTAMKNSYENDFGGRE